MNGKEMSDYLNNLIQNTEIKLDDPLENETLIRFRKSVADTATAKVKLQEQMISIQQLEGTRTAYGQILLDAEKLRISMKDDDNANDQ